MLRSYLLYCALSLSENILTVYQFSTTEQVAAVKQKLVRIISDFADQTSLIVVLTNFFPHRLLYSRIKTSPCPQTYPHLVRWYNHVNRTMSTGSEAEQPGKVSRGQPTWYEQTETDKYTEKFKFSLRKQRKWSFPRSSILSPDFSSTALSIEMSVLRML